MFAVMASAHVYILASKRNGTLYVGVTTDLARRIHEHKIDAADSFTRKHGVKTLVHVETYEDLEEARRRERALKRWQRKWKLELIERDNPRWCDLYQDILS